MGVTCGAAGFFAAESHGEDQPVSARDLKAGESTPASNLPDLTQFDPIAGALAAARATMDAASQAATQAAAAAASAAKASTQAAESAANSAADLPTPRNACRARTAG